MSPEKWRLSLWRLAPAVAEELLCGPLLADRAKLVVLQPEVAPWREEELRFPGAWSPFGSPCLVPHFFGFPILGPHFSWFNFFVSVFFLVLLLSFSFFFGGGGGSRFLVTAKGGNL